MVLNWLLLLILFIGLCVNYRKTIFWVACFFPILNMFGGLGPVSLIQLFGLMAIVVAVCRHGATLKKCPILYAGVVFLIVCGVSNFINERHTPSMLGYVSLNALLPIVLWYFAKSGTEIRLFLKVWTIYLLIICIYGYYEAATNSNPFAEWACDEKNKLFGGYYHAYSSGIRFGVKRIQSLMLWRDACGAISALFWGLLYYFRTYKKEYLDTLWMKYATAALMIMLPVTVLLTGTRACIAILVVCMVGTIKRLSAGYLGVVCIFSILVYLFAAPYISSISHSFSETDSVSGSSIYMRQMQLAAVFNTLKQSPLFGNGFGSWWDYSKWGEDILGAESIWFLLLLKVGLIGTIVFVFIILLLARFIILSKRPYVLVIMIASLVGLTLSSLPGFSMPLLIIFISAMIRIYNNKKMHTIHDKIKR